jgi:hypothetical protein
VPTEAAPLARRKACFPAFQVALADIGSHGSGKQRRCLGGDSLRHIYLRNGCSIVPRPLVRPRLGASGACARSHDFRFGVACRRKEGCCEKLGLTSRHCDLVVEVGGPKEDLVRVTHEDDFAAVDFDSPLGLD